MPKPPVQARTIFESAAFMKPPAERLSTLPAYPFAVLNQRVRELNAQGLDVINLDVGSPDMPPPAHVVEALSESASHPGHHGYSGYKGVPGFRAAIADYYQRRFGVTVDPEREVLPLLGSKEGIVNLSLAFLDRGDIALVPEIGYPAYHMGAHLANGDVHWVPMPGGEFPDVTAVPAEIARRSKLLWVNYPCNPTGAVADTTFYQQMVNYCLENNVLLASDNPYVDVTYDGYVAGSALQAENAMKCTVEFISFSKSHNMAGWRLGAAVGSASDIQTLLQVKSNLDSGHFHAVYDAGISALEHTPEGWMRERNQVYSRRRDRIMESLPKIGLTASLPKGALYIWAKVEDGDGASYAEEALLNAHVSIAPGSIYGPGGTQYVRLSFCTVDSRLEEALQRMENWYSKRG